jgi:hypothetical protein
MSSPPLDWRQLVEELVTLVAPGDASVEAWDVFTGQRQAILERLAELEGMAAADSALAAELRQQYDAVNEGMERLLEQQRQVARELNHLRQCRSRLKGSILTPQPLPGGLDVTA